MTSHLDDILSKRRASLAKAKARRPLSEVRAVVGAREDHRDFLAALTTGARPAIIAEFKRSSPSAGSLNAGADPAVRASAYERGGAAALSVLTEPDRFGGGFADLRAARAATALPVLCKDFVIDEYQIWEATAERADAILLIAAALDERALAELVALALQLRVEPMVEIHDADEITRASSCGARIIAINNRDLHTFAVDTHTAIRLKGLMRAGVATVAESGYRTNKDIARCAQAGFDAVLIGETLMRDDDPQRAVARLRGGP